MSFSRHATFKQLDALETLLNLPANGDGVDIDVEAAVRAVVSLENAIGVALLERHRQGVRLTAAGFSAARRFSATMKKLREGVAALQKHSNAAASGHPFRFGAPWWIDLTRLAEAESLLKQLSHCDSVDFTLMSSTDCCKRVQANQLDAALVSRPVDTGSCHCTDIGDLVSQAALPRNHPLASRSVIDLTELAALPAFVMFKAGINPEQDRWLRERYREYGFVPQRIIRVADAHSMLQMVAAGKAACTFNAVMPPTLYPSGVVFRPLAARTPIVGRVQLIQRPDQPLPVNENLRQLLRSMLQRPAS